MVELWAKVCSAEHHSFSEVKTTYTLHEHNDFSVHWPDVGGVNDREPRYPIHKQQDDLLYLKYLVIYHKGVQCGGWGSPATTEVGMPCRNVL